MMERQNLYYGQGFFSLDIYLELSTLVYAESCIDVPKWYTYTFMCLASVLVMIVSTARMYLFQHLLSSGLCIFDPGICFYTSVAGNMLQITVDCKRISFSVRDYIHHDIWHYKLLNTNFHVYTNMQCEVCFYPSQIHSAIQASRLQLRLSADIPDRNIFAETGRHLTASSLLN